ncbi:MAG: hypothetical protein KatS3mg108_0281 [Isosphaeraceae bacterium]|jgi:RNA polymerase sigma-70 factor (ECF subfamily)|nr:MAG: hypothetical protein KatS3mg108_0281 [Isosphaeraceae bacterium]
MHQPQPAPPHPNTPTTHTPDPTAPSPPDSDARLVERARLGDDHAFALLVQRYERKLLRVLGRLLPDPELARDLAQETFWKIYTRLEHFDTTRRFGPWLFRIGLNLTLDHLRRNANRHTSSLDHRPDSPSTDIPTPDPRLAADLHEEIAHILARLPLEYRTVLILRDLEGFSSSEVAAIIGRREPTVRWRLARARDLFRSAWERRQLDHPQTTKPQPPHLSPTPPPAPGEPR